MPRRVLVLFAHPAFERSRVQRRLLAAAEAAEGVVIRDLYELYPDLDVVVEAEQAALTAADAVVFQHPLHWYSAPPIIKQWQDLVLEHGWAYGAGGDALAGKLTFHALSAGGKEEAYRAEGANRFTLTELLRPFEQTAALCGMRWLPPFAVHGTLQLEDAALDAAAQDYRQLLEAVRDGRLDEAEAARRPGLHHRLDQLIATAGVA